MENFLTQNDDDKIVTPETLAWKLLMEDENIMDYAGILDMQVIDPSINNNNNTNNNTKSNSHIGYDDMVDQFQILITIYMEMIFGMLRISHVSDVMDKNGDIDDCDLENTFKPDFTNVTINDILDVFKERFKKIRIILSVREIYDTDMSNVRNFGKYSDYYCRIILKDTPEGFKYFEANRDTLNPDIRYTFVIRRDEDNKQTKLSDFYAVCALPNMKVKISFDVINIV